MSDVKEVGIESLCYAILGLAYILFLTGVAGNTVNYFYAFMVNAIFV